MSQQSWDNTTVKVDPELPESRSLNWQKWIGVVACGLLIISCFMHWAYYSDIQKHFSGFDSKVMFRGKMQHYYGRPGILLCFFAVSCLIFHLLPKVWAKRANLLFAGLCMAYAIRTYFMFSAAYSGYIPQKETGLWLMLIAAVVNLMMVIGGKV